MSGGAVIAAAAAAHTRRVRTLVDAFRLAGATAPERARTPESIGAARGAVFDELVRDGVLVAGPGAGTWYLGEAAYVARRDSRSARARRALVLVTGMLILVIVLLATLTILLGRVVRP